jgi:hypothetical protein
MKAAEDRFGVTVYRNTGLDNDGQIGFSKQLGALEAHKLLSEIQGAGANNIAEYSVIPPRFGSVVSFRLVDISDGPSNLLSVHFRPWKHRE